MSIRVNTATVYCYWLFQKLRFAVSFHIWTNYVEYRIYTVSREPIRLHVPENQYPVFGT